MTNIQEVILPEYKIPPHLRKYFRSKLDNCYVCHIVQVFREIWRVLRKDGTVWLNLGDSYWGTGAGPGSGNFSLKDIAPKPRYKKTAEGLKPKDLCGIPWRVALALQADEWWLRRDIIWFKNNPMPESVNGWRWERHRVKVKPSARAKQDSAHSIGQNGVNNPQGARDGVNFADHSNEYQDCAGCPKCTPNNGLILRKGAWRPTSAHEYLFLLTKSDTYFCDAEAVREKYTGPINRWGGQTQNSDTRKQRYYRDEMQNLGSTSALRPGADLRPNPVGRNLRSVWQIEEENDCLLAELEIAITEGIVTREQVEALLPERKKDLSSVWQIPTQPFPQSHFAVFPEKLVEPCIKAGTSEKGCCPECGAPWVRVVEKANLPLRHPKDVFCKSGNKDRNDTGELYQPKESKTIGWKPSCECYQKKTVAALGTLNKTIPCTVLDPFGGSGRTAIVAKKLGRKCIIIELKEEYCEMPLDELRQENIF